MIRTIFRTLLLMLISTVFAIASDQQEGTLLTYLEREPGIDEYEVTMLVTDRYIRVDESGVNSGFIVYDDKQQTIYSVSHHDKSILVINKHKFTEDQGPIKAEVEYLELAHAPTVDGKAIYNYRVFIGKESNEETCMELQLVEGLLPEVTKVLKNYQIIVSGQQVKMTDNNISEMQSACFFVDQIYNTGAYYDKGLPIQEWHSNERSRILVTYKAVKTSEEKFKLPEGYRKFSITKDTRIKLQ